MTQIIGISASDAVQRSSDLDPFTRVAMIVDHANQLAAQASGIAPIVAHSPVSVRTIIDARAARQRHFDSDLFADPAWDILLELYALRCEQRRTSVSKLCVGINVPMTTGLRWIDRLGKDGLIERESDPLDARRVWVSLSDRGFDSMSSYLRELADRRTACDRKSLG